MNTESDNSSPSVAEVEREVVEQSAVFKKELGLFDLVLTQVVFVVGTFWVGWAAKLGHEQSMFWILAIATFYVPLAAAVIFLNRLMPYEGGLYQWSKLAFNDFVAFMVGWNLLVFAISIMAGIGLVVTTNLSYAIGPTAAWMRDSAKMTMLISCILVTAMVVAATRGLALGKWVHKVGGIVVDNRDAIAEAYTTGRGSFRVRAKWHKEDTGRGTYLIIITEVPWLIQKGRLV